MYLVDIYWNCQDEKFIQTSFSLLFSVFSTVRIVGVLLLRGESGCFQTVPVQLLGGCI